MMGSSSGWHFPSPESADMVYDVYDSDDPRQGTGSLSRLSLCTSSMYEEDDDDDDDDEDGDGVFDGTRMSMSKLSLESCFNADDEEEQAPEGRKMVKGTGLDFDMIITSSDSDKDQPGGGGGGCYSLPGTPPGRRRRSGQVVGGAREYASENESNRRKQRSRRRRAGGGSGNSNKRSGGSGLVVITRPKGGQRSLCMDLEEVKACRDLGFELEHERMMEVPATNRLSFSGSTTLDTSSGGNSPIANWRISSPGDDPRDVKARLKVWAQAVAIASTTSRHGGGF